LAEYSGELACVAQLYHFAGALSNSQIGDTSIAWAIQSGARADHETIAVCECALLSRPHEVGKDKEPSWKSSARHPKVIRFPYRSHVHSYRRASCGKENTTATASGPPRREPCNPALLVEVVVLEQSYSPRNLAGMALVLAPTSWLMSLIPWNEPTGRRNNSCAGRSSI
jgi:hypothetical protein